MPKFIRKNLQGIEFVHVTTHGIDNKYIYETTKEKREIKKLIFENQKTFNINIVAYCVMNNHLHLLINFQNPKDLSNYMHKVNTSYGIYYNKNHKRNGYVYKDRFYSQIIKNKNHLINAIVYIHNNPVKANICDYAEDYEFCSYKDFLDGNFCDLLTFFDSKEQYIRAHLKNNVDYKYFIEFEKLTLEEMEKILNDYLKENKLDKKELKYKIDEFYKICRILKEDYKVSYRNLEKITGIGRETIRRILTKNVTKRGDPFVTKEEE